MVLDKVRRGPLLTCTLIACFYIFHPCAANTSIALIYLFGIIFSFDRTPFSSMRAVECLHIVTRTEGKSLAQLFISVLLPFSKYTSGLSFENISTAFISFTLPVTC